jgi:hypothetical protein
LFFFFFFLTLPGILKEEAFLQPFCRDDSFKLPKVSRPSTLLSFFWKHRTLLPTLTLYLVNILWKYLFLHKFSSLIWLWISFKAKCFSSF